MKLSYLDLTTTDPAWNLAVEQVVFDELPRDRAYLMLWQNENTVVVGRYQNTWAQVNEDFVRARSTQVIRRRSGGGAVYHDLGNLNFTLIVEEPQGEDAPFFLFCQPVLRALAALGVRAERTGRNDLTIGGKKFSGNAQYRRAGRVMHHGTLLFDTDLAAAEGALRVPAEKLTGKGVTSVQSRITNLRPYLPRDMSLPEFRGALLSAILRETPGEPWSLSEGERERVEHLRKERYASWEWNWGRSPACTLLRRARVEGCGGVEVYLTLQEGRIEGVSFQGDFFAIEEPESLARRLIGCPLERESCLRVLAGEDVSRYFIGLDREAFLDLLTGGERPQPGPGLDDPCRRTQQ